MNTTTVEMVGRALAQVMRTGEITNAREGTRFAAELLGVSLPEKDYLKLEELCPFSMMVGAAVALAHLELMKENND